MYAGATELAVRGRSEPEAGYGFDLSGRVGTGTQVNAVYVHGWNPGVSPVFRYGMHPSRGHLRIRTPGWSLEAGEIRNFNPVTGVVARADGASFQKTGGVLIGSLAAARPKYFAGGWGGHLYQGSLGIKFDVGSVSFLASDFARPIRMARIVANDLPQADSELVTEDLQQIGELLSRENQIRSAAIETRLKFGRHNIIARGGWIDLINSDEERSDGAMADGSYSFQGARGSIAAQFRTGPSTLPGTTVMGDLLSVGAKIKIVGPFALIGTGSWQETSLFGRERATQALGTAAGVEYSKDRTRVYLHGNYRESRYLATSVTRSITAGVRVPFGIAGVISSLEFGEAEYANGSRRIASYRGSFYLEGEHASAMLSGSYRDYGISTPRLHLDLSGTFDWRGTTIEGGTGLSRAGIFGNVFNAWTTVEFPVPGDLAILLGADYDRWSFEDSPYLIFLMEEDATPPWRFTVSVRKNLTARMPFVK